MKRVLLGVLAILMLIGSTACRRQETSRRYFAYLDAPAEATLTGHVNALAFTATLETQGRGEGGAVNAKLTFTSPGSLAGISLVCQNGIWSASLGTLVGETGARGLGRIPTLLIEERAVRSSKAAENALVLALSDGANLFLDKKTGIPLRAEWNDGARAIEVIVVDWKGVE